MAAIVLSSLGGVAGSAAGGVIGGIFGYMATSMLSGALFGRRHENHIVGGRLSDLVVQNSAYAKTIPIVYGNVRLAGNIIWSLPLREHTHHNTSHMSGGKGGGGGGVSVTSTSYSYSVTLAIGICEGEIDTICNIWADAKVLSFGGLNCRLYKGSKDQMPDPLIQAHMGVGSTPAYRDMAYLVIEDFPLADYGNRIPNFTFEVRRRAKVDGQQKLPVEDLITAICMIPGSGEFVYDTQIQYKMNGGLQQKGRAEALNMHNNQAVANAVLALDQLQDTCPNIEWVAPVVTWFATSLDIAKCKVRPGIEHADLHTSPDTWKVGNYTRSNSHTITLKDGSPIYGGTVADDAILRYLTEIKRRKIKVLFYPMIFVDLVNKPWRGHITGKIEDLAEFLKEYEAFILHYARLVKGKVDAFIIGSELKSLTALRSPHNDFPMVDFLCELASRVKQILGHDVKLTYAADWSEYHHTDGGWYHMDKLWAHSAIDYIGIDAYFPLTCDQKQIYDEQRIVDGWGSGEGYEYYYSDAQCKLGKQKLSPAYAWKNLEWFWAHEHINPNGKQTLWRARSKKIWFTEFGFPSLDCATNQPNVFYDPQSYDGGVPIYSKGRVDFRAQRMAISATLSKWANSEVVERMFLWTWDARPYPYWPRLASTWKDAYLWAKGHWVNGKIGLCRISDIIVELCLKSGFVRDQIDVSSLIDVVDGYIIYQQQSARVLLENLLKSYFIDVVEDGAKLKFIARNERNFLTIGSEELVDLDQHKSICVIRKQEQELPQQISVIYMDGTNSFQPAVVSSRLHGKVTNEHYNFDTNLVLTQSFAEHIARVNLYNAWQERVSYQFYLPPAYLVLQVGDLVTIKEKQMRVESIAYMADHTMRINAVQHDSELYSYHTMIQIPRVEGAVPNLIKYQYYLLDLPLHMLAEDDELCVYLAVTNLLGEFRAANLYYALDGEHYRYLDFIESEAVMGTVVTSLIKPVNGNVIDYENKLIIHLISGDLESKQFDQLLQGANLALIGNEIIQFAQARLIEPYKYEVSVLLRGRMGSEQYINQHSFGERFVLLDSRLKKITIPRSLLGVELKMKLLASGQKIEDGTEKNIAIEGRSLKPLSPVHLKYQNERLSWIRRARFKGLWRDFAEVRVDEEEERYQVDILQGDAVIERFITDRPFCEIHIDVENVHFRVAQISSVVGKGSDGFL